MSFRPSIILLISLVVLTASCRKSVLSDIDIDEPENLTVRVKIYEKRKKKRLIHVSIRDNTNHPVEFSNGTVLINQEEAEFSLRTAVSSYRGYNYRIPANTHEFEVTIEWNETDSYTFLIDEDAGFPGFEYKLGINVTRGSDSFTITPAPFLDNKIEVSYDLLN